MIGKRPRMRPSQRRRREHRPSKLSSPSGSRPASEILKQPKCCWPTARRNSIARDGSSSLTGRRGTSAAKRRAWRWSSFRRGARRISTRSCTDLRPAPTGSSGVRRRSTSFAPKCSAPARGARAAAGDGRSLGADDGGRSTGGAQPNRSRRSVASLPSNIGLSGPKSPGKRRISNCLRPGSNKTASGSARGSKNWNDGPPTGKPIWKDKRRGSWPASSSSIDGRRNSTTRGSARRRIAESTSARFGDCLVSCGATVPLLDGCRALLKTHTGRIRQLSSSAKAVATSHCLSEAELVHSVVESVAASAKQWHGTASSAQRKPRLCPASSTRLLSRPVAGERRRPSSRDL